MRRSISVRMIAGTLALTGCNDEPPAEQGCQAQSYELGASCTCDSEDARCVYTDGGERRSMGCVDDHWRAGEAAACQLAPEAAFEQYVRGRGCRAVTTNAKGGSHTLGFFVLGDWLQVIVDDEATGWRISNATFSTLPDGEVLWLDVDARTLVKSGVHSSAQGTLRVGVRNMALNGWEVGFGELPDALAFTRGTDWVHCEFEHPID